MTKILDQRDCSVNEKEGDLLFDLARKCTGKGVIIEIGSWKGKSTIRLAKGSKLGKRCKIYAIDPHVGSPQHTKIVGKVWTFDQFKKNIKEAEVEDIVVPIVATSEEAAKRWSGKPIELLWIDGNHDYEFVKQDIFLWKKYLINGGIIALHDTLKGGAKEAVDKFIYWGKEFRNIRFKSSIIFAEKTGKLSSFEKLENFFAFCFREGYLFLRKIYYKFM